MKSRKKRISQINQMEREEREKPLEKPRIVGDKIGGRNTLEKANAARTTLPCEGNFLSTCRVR
jgi:hypothetical protein